MSCTPTPQEQARIAQALVDWFTAQGKDYPWRRTTDPWAILVSEVMLQQTTIPTVLGRYGAWMQQFPTPEALAAATEEQALRSWEGLGYYRRVRALQAAARAVAEQGGVFPEEEQALRALPGIGDYTAAAVLSFAFNRPAALVDANVARVFARLTNDRTPVDSPAGRRAQRELAASMVHPQNPRAYNSALMELGQTLCTSGQPQCLLCPIRPFCRAEKPEELPVKLPKKEVTALEHWDVFSLSPEGLLLQKQPGGGRHAGMYRLPRRSPEYAQGLPFLCAQRYSVTRYKVTRYLHTNPAEPAQADEERIPAEHLPGIPMASPDRKLILRFLSVQHDSEKA